jgi:hypothetical protein
MHHRLLSCAFAGAILVAPGMALADSGSLHEEHSFQARPGATVLIDVSFHRVEVVARPGGTVDVTVDLEVTGSTSKVKKYLNELQPEFLDKDDTLVIRSVSKKMFHWRSPKTSGHVTVQMPPGMNLTIDSSSGSCEAKGDFGDAMLSIDVSSGSIVVTGAAREVMADTSSGSITLELERPADRVTADTSSGSISLTGGAGSLRADTSSGSIQASGLHGDATLDTSSGAITAAWSRIPARAEISADTSSGGVTLRFPAGTQLTGKVDTSSGPIRSDFPGELSDRRRTMEIQGGPDAATIKVDTSSGGVQLLMEER